jgi:hypothetical protein
MPLTLDEVKSLIGAFGLKVPEAVLEQKARAEEFQARQAKVAGEAGGKPAGWRLKADFDTVLNRAVAAAGQNQFDDAFKMLDEAGQLLQQADAPPPTPRDASEGGTAGEKVLFAQARLKWDNARKQSRAGLEKFVDAARSEFQREPDFKTIEAAIQKFLGILEGLDERLLDKLDEAYNARTPEAEKALRQQAAAIVKEHQAFVAGNALLSGLDTNPIMPVQVEGPLRKTLDELAGLMG